MAFQPDNDITKNGFIELDQDLFFPIDFHGAIDHLTFGEGDGTLHTPTLERSNAFIPSMVETYLDEIRGESITNFQELFSMSLDQESSVPSETTNDDAEFLLLDSQAIINGIEINSDQEMNVPKEEAIKAIENDLRSAVDEISDSIDLQQLVTAVNRYPNQIMRMHTQPLARNRLRYRTDGIRYLERSRQTPMSIHVLPRLDGCLTKPYQAFWLQLTLVTTRNNPQHKVFIHQHEMIYNGEDAVENGLRSFRIPLTDEDIHRRQKTFRHLSIIKTKLGDYTFQLTPFDPLMKTDHTEYYTVPNEDQLTKVQKAKKFDRVYHMNNFQIVCQLLIKQKDQWHMTDLYCETHII